jgi:hypothetical protein
VALVALIGVALFPRGARTYRAKERAAAVNRQGDTTMRFMAMVETGGPLPRATGARGRLSGGIPTVTDGPFIETKELIAGYAAHERTRGSRRAKRRFRRSAGARGPRLSGIDGERRRSIA